MLSKISYLDLFIEEKEKPQELSIDFWLSISNSLLTT